MRQGWRRPHKKASGLILRLGASLLGILKRRLKLVTIFTIAVVAGQLLSSLELAAQTPASSLSLTTLKSVPVPEPSNLGDFVKDRGAAIALGKSLFWDMQVGSDGKLSCASCHFQAGADNRAKNQLSPGLLQVNSDRTPNPDVLAALGFNYTLKPEDFPFHKLSDPTNRNSKVLADTNDVASSQGVFNAEFIDVVPGSPQDSVTHQADAVFNVGGVNVRRVEPRNAPSVINAIFNFRNFWDGRAQNIFNGVNPFGTRDPYAFVLRSPSPTEQPLPTQVRIDNASLASLSVGPPLSSFEMSADGRTFEEIGQKFGSVEPRSKSGAKGRKLPRDTGKKLLRLRPLGQQLVHPEDSVLGAFSQAPETGLNLTYESLIQTAFQPQWWNSNYVINVDPETGERTLLQQAQGPLNTNQYTLAEYNFSLFFGLALQLYQSTLVSNNAPIDQYLEGNLSVLTAQQLKGKELFEGKAKCINCHGGAEFTNASVRNVQNQRLERMVMEDGQVAVYDNGFYNIGVRPTSEDLGVGSNDPFGNPLSDSRMAQQGKFNDPNLSPPVSASERVAVDGAFKTPGLRNIELTAPYFHNGGQLTLEQVVQFYNRGGDRRGRNGNDTTGFEPNKSNLDADIQTLGLTNEEQAALVAFMKALTDERVRYARAPFDHPQLFIPNGHPGDRTAVVNDGTGKATDSFVEIPAVGRNGGNPLPSFPAPTA